MSTNSTVRRCWRSGLLLFLFLSVTSVGVAKTKGSRGSGDTDLSNIIRPELMNAGSDPTLRFPVMSTVGAITYGWLDITSSTIRYTEMQPSRRSTRSFAVSRYAISNLEFNRSTLAFKVSKRWQQLIYVPQDQWGQVHLAFHGLSNEASRDNMGTASIYKTLLNFDGVLALVKPPAPPPAPAVVQTVAPEPAAKPAAPPSPPAIVLSSPPGAGENRPIDSEDSTVVIRGVAMDSSGIPVVRINGSPANMRPQTTQAAEFWTDPLPLQAGTNHILIVASNSAHVEATLDLTVNYHPKVAPVNTRGLDRLDIIGLLQGGVPPARVADLVKDRGIKFSPSADDLKAIRDAGGTDELIEAIQQAAPKP
ncbi:MAG: hypothetical protein WAO35_02875 [Terriglobia bacterium]